MSTQQEEAFCKPRSEAQEEATPDAMTGTSGLQDCGSIGPVISPQAATLCHGSPRELLQVTWHRGISHS